MAAGTTGVIYSNRECLFRLQTLIVDGGTEVIRNLFDQRLHGVVLKVFLAKEKNTLKILKQQKIITKTQYDLLYPPSGQTPSSADFDITLIICLLRNIPSLGLNHSFLWNVPPLPADLSLEADLCRLKGFRNEVAHISSTTGFQQTSFHAKWIEIEQVFLRLNRTLTNPLSNFNQTIDSYKYISLDAAAEQRNQTIIEQWRQMERGLETEMLLIKKDVESIIENASDTKQYIKNVEQDVRDTRQGVENIEQDVKITKQCVTDIEKDVRDAKKDVKKVEQDFRDTSHAVNLIEQGVGETKEGMKYLEQGVTDTKQDVKNIEHDVRNTRQDVKVIEQNVICTMQGVKKISKDVSYTKQYVGSLNKNVNETKEDVHVIKQEVEVIKKNINNTKPELPDRGRRGKPGIFGRISTFFGFGQKPLLKDIKTDLISFYKRQHKIIPLSPLIKEDQPLLKFYVMPAIQSIKVTRCRDGDIEVKTPVTRLRDVFYKENKLCSNIYLAADAGFGKTAFSKRLVLTWCHSQIPDESEERHFSDDEIADMCGFSFVFLVLLRESSTECDIDMLIFNQIFSQLSHDYKLENLRNILHEETCLVVLDGLDEWTHPLEPCKPGRSSIPHQRVRENMSVLTTTRPWKLSVSGLHSSQIDQKLELTGLSDDSARKLKRSVISYLHEEQDVNKIKAYEAKFNKTVQEKHKSDLTAIPLFLMYFLFLWFYKFNVGRSLADLCSSITELLLSRTFKKDGIQIPRADNVPGKTPLCFDRNALCKQFYSLLTSLGELAFHTLFNETKENTLVFNGCVAERFLNKDDLTFCLNTGIITQSKVQGASLVEEKTKVSFAHKTLQEFLAALYICSSPDHRSVQEIVELKYKGVKDILDMSKILMFIVGINAKSAFSRELVTIINADEITQEYRNSLQDIDMFSKHPLYDLHDMYISCCKEIPRENEVNLYLQDVFIDWRCEEKEYHENLKRLTTRNKRNIKSLYINMYDMLHTPYKTAKKVIDYFKLSDLENIEKIYYKCKYNDDDIFPLLKSSVKCLSLSCGLQLGSLSHRLFLKVTSLHKLEAIKISEFKMRHTELRLLLDFISQRDCMKKIKLERLDCTDHWSSCTSQNIDLSRHSSIRELTLRRVRLSKVIVNMASLEKCYLRDLSNQDLGLEFFNCADSVLNTFVCESLQSVSAIHAVLQTLSLLRYIRHVKLDSINLSKENPFFSPLFVNMESLRLIWVTIEASILREMVDSVLTLQQPVTVDIRGCSISPKEEFILMKETIRSSDHLKILCDKEDRGSETFVFETIQD